MRSLAHFYSLKNIYRKLPFRLGFGLETPFVVGSDASLAHSDRNLLSLSANFEPRGISELAPARSTHVDEDATGTLRPLPASQRRITVSGCQDKTGPTI